MSRRSECPMFTRTFGFERAIKRDNNDDDLEYFVIR